MPTEVIKIFRCNDDEMIVGLSPRYNGSPKFLIVELNDVRAADGIRLSYDFDRDGWRVEQASTFSWPAGVVPDPDWQEVAFVQAWAREKTI